MAEAFTMDKKCVVESPKDEILEGVIVDVIKTKWSEFIDPTKINKFDNPEEEIVKVKYETLYKNNHLKGEESFKYYPAPMANSNLGKFLMKYNNIAVGVKIKVIFDGKGVSSIKLD